MSLDYYGLDGQKISLEEWGRICGSPEKILARTDLIGGVWVSTVLLGLDHSFGDGPPLIFETMVFADDDMADLDCVRYSTKEQALAGHKRVVTKWMGWKAGDPVPEENEECS